MRIPGRFIIMTAFGLVLAGASASSQTILSSVFGGGGGPATDGHGLMDGTIGQSIIGPVTSATNEVDQGFWYMLPKLSTVSVHQEPVAAGPAVMLYQNAPNPFSTSTEIAFDLPTSGRVSLKLIDGLGNEVTTVIDEVREAGRITTTVRGEQLESGYYIARLVANGVTKTIRMVVVR